MLEEPKDYALSQDFDSIEEAYWAIKNQGNNHTEYTIIPYIRIRE